MDVFFYLEYPVGRLEHHAEVDVKRRSIRGKCTVISVFDVASGPLPVFGRDALGHVVRIQIFDAAEASLEVNLGLRISVAVFHHQGGDAGKPGAVGLVCPECRCNVDDPGTGCGGHIVAGDDTESAIIGAEPRDELLVSHAHKFGTLESAGQDFIRNLVVKPGAHKCLGKNICRRLARIGVLRLDFYVFDIRADAEGGIGRKSPRRGRPGEEVKVVFTDDLELGCACGVLDIAVAAWLVELVGAEAGSGSRRIRLYGFALVEQPLAVYILEQPPQSFDVTVVIGDVRVVHIHPVADTLGKIPPFGSIFHHLLAAGAVVFLNTYLCPDVFLGDAELLLDSKFDRESVSIPAGTAADLVTGLRLIAADSILDRACHHMMDARHPVGGRRSFEENKLRSTFTKLEGLLKRPLLLPLLKHLLADRNEIKSAVLFECHIFCLILQYKLICKFNYFRQLLQKRMAILDIIILICFVPAIVKGISKGLMRQVVELVAILVGAWAAFHFSSVISNWLSASITINHTVLNVICFVLVVVIVCVLLFLPCSMLNRLLKAVSLGWVDTGLGIIFGVLKTALIIGLVIMVFESLNSAIHIVKPGTLADSPIYCALRNFAGKIFPYLKGLVTSGNV